MRILVLLLLFFSLLYFKMYIDSELGSDVNILHVHIKVAQMKWLRRHSGFTGFQYIFYFFFLSLSPSLVSILSTNAKIPVILQSFYPEWTERWVDRFHIKMLKQTRDEWTSVIVIVAMPTPTLTQTWTLTPTLFTVKCCETIHTFFHLFSSFYLTVSIFFFIEVLLKGWNSKLWINAAPEHRFMCMCAL